MRKPLKQEFQDTAAAAHAAFPQELSRLTLLLMPVSDTPVYLAPGVADRLTKDTAVIKELVAKEAKWLQSIGAAAFAQRSFNLAGTPVNLIGLIDAEHMELGYFTDSFTKEMRVLFNLDHEVGHLILKNGYPSGTVTRRLAESAADAYGVLRHIQRFGMNSAHMAGYAESRAGAIVLHPDIAHYTTDTVHRTLEVAKERDVSGLSLRETAKLAEQIAGECHIASETLGRVAGAYKPVHEAVKEQIGAVPEMLAKLYAQDKEAYALFCRETVAVMKAHEGDADVFRAGKQLLQYPLIRRFMKAAAQTDPVYRDMLAFIDAAPASARKCAGPVSALSFMSKMSP